MREFICCAQEMKGINNEENTDESKYLSGTT